MDKATEKKLDIAFSKLVKITRTNDNGTVYCITCNKPFNYKDPMIECGHFVKRRHLATRYLLLNCWPQCKTCNQYKDTDALYKQKLISMFGEEKIENLELLGKSICKISQEEATNLLTKIEEELKSWQKKRN